MESWSVGRARERHVQLRHGVPRKNSWHSNYGGTFSNLVLKGKLRKAIKFVCDREKGGFFQPDELAADGMGTIDKTFASVLEGKYPSRIIISYVTLEMYKDMPIIIPFDITEEAV